MTGAIEKNKIIQICVLVKNVEETAKHWAKFLKVDMPALSITEKYDVTHAIYKGKECNGRIYQAVFQFDNVELEIVGPVDEEPSYWYDYLQEHGEGLHHIALHTKNMDDAIAEFAEDGYPEIQRGSWPDEPVDGQYAYLDTVEKLKCSIELLCF